MGGCEAEASGDGSATGHWLNEHRGVRTANHSNLGNLAEVR